MQEDEERIEIGKLTVPKAYYKELERKAKEENITMAEMQSRVIKRWMSQIFGSGDFIEVQV